jgi:hypothetical protein
MRLSVVGRVGLEPTTKAMEAATSAMRRTGEMDCSDLTQPVKIALLENKQCEY